MAERKTTSRTPRKKDAPAPAVEERSAAVPAAVTRAGSPLVPLEQPAAPVPAPVPAAAPKAAARVDLGMFWRMQHAGAEMRAAKQAAETAKQEAEAARLKRLYVLQVLDPKGRVVKIEEDREAALKKVLDADRKAESHENTYIEVKRQIEARIGRALSSIAIDPDTGEIHAA